MNLENLLDFRSVRGRLLTGSLLLGLIPLIVVGWLAYQKSSTALIEQTGHQLGASAQGIADTLDRNLFERYGDVQAFAFNPLARGSAADITRAANFFTRAYGIYDLMLVADADGRILAANTVRADGTALDTSGLLGQSVKDEEWFRKCIGGEIGHGESYYSDLEKDPRVAKVYGNNGLSLNFSAPVFDENDQVVRVWSNRASGDRIIGEIAEAAREQMLSQGIRTSEIQVLRKDGVLIDDKDPKAILEFNLAGAGLEAAKEAIQGKQGFVIEQHKRRKIMQVNGYAPSRGALGFPGYGWSVLSRQDLAEATAGARQIRTFTLFVLLLAAGVIVGVASWMAAGFARPLGKAVQTLEAAAQGDLTVDIEATSRDEVGQMARALGTLLHKLRGGFQGIQEQAQTVAGAATEMESVGQQLGTQAAETSRQAETVAAASEQVTQNIQTVSAGAEELAASSHEIAQNTADASKVGQQAVEAAHRTNETVSKLGESSIEVGNIIKVITSIAEQTNLLALNATIEAARAGEAGKGFAVVANEVKDLAKQTGDATEDIGRKIEAIQQDTQHAVQAINEIGSIIDRVNDFQTTIATAVEEQTATSNEISRNIGEAAKGAMEIGASIAGVAKTAQATSESTGEMSSSSGSLAELAVEMEKLVKRFKI